MESITKSTVYSRLIDIRDKHNVDISKYINMIAGKTSIPYDVLIFINKFYPIEQLYTYNKIYENRKKNPLYKNLVNENLPDADKLIALSSFTTQVFIKCKDLANSGRENEIDQYLELMCIKDICNSLVNYDPSSDESKRVLNETFMEIRNMFKNLYRKDGDIFGNDANGEVSTS